MKLTWERLDLRARVPFRISRSVQERIERVWVRLEHDGLEGWGEADPPPYYGGSAATVGAALERMRPVLAGVSDPDRLEGIEADLRTAVPENGSEAAPKVLFVVAWSTRGMYGP